jgi:thioesterase domain-containing protein
VRESAALHSAGTLVMKSGTGDPPVFIAHGLGATSAELSPLIENISLPNPVYGFQTRGLDEAETPFASIEEMAQFHLEAIKHLQFHGPYFLVGYSLGGLVMLETAQRLLAAGESIGVLLMIDSYPRNVSLSLNARFRRAFRRTLRRISRIGHTPDQHPAKSLALHRVHRSGQVALQIYRPRFYSGKLDFIGAAEPTNLPDDPRAIWQPLAKSLDIETVPGDHRTMLTAYGAALGSAVSRRLQRNLSVAGEAR